MSLRKRAHDLAKKTPEKLRNLFKPEHLQPSLSSPGPSPSPSTDPCATAATSSGCPPTSEQQPTPPLRVHTGTTPPVRDDSSRDCLRPMSASEIRERTYAALTKRLTSEELRRVKWERPEGSTAKIIEDLKTTLRENNKHSKTTSNILQHINKYCTIVDIAIQHHPDITALVWAGARTLIQLATNHYETLISLEQATEAITTSLLKCEFYHRLYVSFAETSNSQVPDSKVIFHRLEGQLPELYAVVIELSVKSTTYMASSVLSASFKPFSLEFKPLLDEIATQEKDLKELASSFTVMTAITNSTFLEKMKYEMEEWGSSVTEKLDATCKSLEQVRLQLAQTIDDKNMSDLVKYRKWLGALQNPEVEYDNNRKHLPDTGESCGWLLKTKQFQTFTDPQEGKHIWVHGKPGAGKSVLSSFAITQLRKHPRIELQVLHFFCKDGSSETSTALAIASSLIDQLIGHGQLSALFEILKSAHREHAKSDKCTDFGILWNIFVALARNFPARIIVVVDALDECNVDRERFLDKIISREMDDMDGKLRLFMTSRNDHEIIKKLENHSGTVRLEMNVEEDIKAFVIRRLPELNRLQDMLRRPDGSNLEERIIQGVPRYAGGMFRYAALLLEELNGPWVDVAKTLDSPPSGLDGMYESILSRLESADTHRKNRGHRKTLLHWVAMAMRPLKVTELAYACAAQNEEEFDPAGKTLIDTAYILEICGPLIEIVNGTVQFTHLSAKEFLFQKPKNTSTVQNEYLINKTKTEVAITNTCISILRNGLAGKLGVGTSYPKDYFVVYWLLHAMSIENVAPDAKATSSKLWDCCMKFLTFFFVGGKLRDWSRRLSFDTVQQHGRAEGREVIPIVKAYRN